MQGSRSTGDSQAAILVADASKVTLVAARKLLEPHFSVYLAEDGLAAWELLESLPEICAVFTDQNLPRLDAQALLAKLRAADDPRLADLPVIITTSGERNEATRRAAVDAGATDFIIKPFDALDLLTRARAWCGSSQRAATMRDHHIALRELVLLDADTRSGNREYFLQEAIKDRSFCSRHGGNHALMYIAIDQFDTQLRGKGRQAARDAAATVAAAIRAKCRREDTFARVADGAFALSLLHTAPLNARVLAERIRQEIAGKGPLTVSIGIAATPDDPAAAAGSMLDDAENAAREAARAGGNRVHVDPVAAALAPAPAMPAPAPATAPDHDDDSDDDATPIDVEQALADPAAFIGALLPVLQKLSDGERLVLIDRLLLMSETTSGT